MKYSSRFFLYAPLGLFLILAGGAMAHWWIIANAFNKKLTALNGHEAVPGITVSFTSKTVSGFPFNIDVVFTGLRVAGAGAHGPFSWSTERFALHRLTYGRTQDIYEAAGQQHVSWASDDGNIHDLSFLPGSLRASAITGKNGLTRFDLDAVALGGPDNKGKPFTVARLQFHMRRDPDGHDLDLMISADDVKTEAMSVHALTAYTTLTKAAAIAPLLAGTQSWPEADKTWVAAGGTALLGKQSVAGGVAYPILKSLY